VGSNMGLSPEQANVGQHQLSRLAIVPALTVWQWASSACSVFDGYSDVPVEQYNALHIPTHIRTYICNWRSTCILHITRSVPPRRAAGGAWRTTRGGCDILQYG
jgi:hypothetical protein